MTSGSHRHWLEAVIVASSTCIYSLPGSSDTAILVSSYLRRCATAAVGDVGDVVGLFQQPGDRCDAPNNGQRHKPMS